jgi:5'-3' exonuclease
MLAIKEQGRLGDVNQSILFKETDRIALIDADSMLYYTLGQSTYEEAILKLDQDMFKLLEEVRTPHFAAITTPRTHFRKQIAKTKPYKGNRSGKKTPPIFYAVAAYARQEWGFYDVPGLEADDCMGLYRNENTVICSPDKDVIRQLPGHHYNYGKGEWIQTTEDDAWEFLWTQAATGDSVDQIPGIQGVGPKTMEKVLLTVRKQDYPLRILQMYIEKKGKDESVKSAINRFKETLDLVYMLQSEEEAAVYGITLPELKITDVKTLYVDENT